MAKYIQIGQVVRNNDGTEAFKLSLDNLKEVVKLLRTYGMDKLSDLSIDDISNAKKLPKGDPNKLMDPYIARFDKTEEDYAKGCPDWILANLCLKKENFE